MSETDEFIGKNLARFRGDMSQQGLAEAMRSMGWKWSQATVWSVEKGERPLRLAEASDLARILDVGLGHFVAPQMEQMRLNNAWTHVRGLSEGVASLWQSLESINAHHHQLATYVRLIEAIPPARWDEIGLGTESRTLLDNAKSYLSKSPAEHVQQAFEDAGVDFGKHSEEA